MTQAELERSLAGFEGLVKTTASQIVAGGVEMEYDDVRQILRTKVWQAVLKFNEERAAAGKSLSQPRRRTPLERFVFMCVANARKDIEKRPRRFNLSVDGMRDEGTDPCRADAFDARYLSVDADHIFSQAEEEDHLPSSLTAVERRVVALRLEGRHLTEIDRILGLSRAQRESLMESLRLKLRDLAPTEQRSAPMPPLPRAEQPAAREMLSRAA